MEMELITIEQLIKKVLNDHQIDTTGLNLNVMMKMARPYIFDFDYPVVTPDYKEKFELQFLRKFLRYYLCYTKNDIDYWEIDLEYALNLIMPYYNQLIKSEEWFDKYITNPANNTDYLETYTRTTNGSQTDTGNATTSGTESQTDIGNGTTTSTSSSTNNTDSTSTTETETTEKDDETNTTTSTSESTSSNTADTTENSTAKTTSGIEGNDKTIDNDLPKSAIDFEDYASAIGLTTTTQSTTTDNSTTGTNKTTQSATANTSDSGTATKKTNNTTTESNTTTVNQKNTQADEGKSVTDTTNNTDKQTNASTKTDNSSVTKQSESYEFRRVGNIGVQTPGEVFASTRKAFINTMDMILKDKEITTLFLGVLN